MTRINAIQTGSDQAVDDSENAQPSDVAVNMPESNANQEPIDSPDAKPLATEERSPEPEEQIAQNEQADTQVQNNPNADQTPLTEPTVAANQPQNQSSFESEQPYQFDNDVSSSELEAVPVSLDYFGWVKNNGVITVPTDQLLNLGGQLQGDGQFLGDVLLKDNIVNPGNSPGLLTFDNLIWQSSLFEVEIQNKGQRGVDYDAIDVMGDLTLVDSLDINMILLDGILLSELYDYPFEILQVFGDFYDINGLLLQNPFALSLTIDGGWTTQWQDNGDSWSLFNYFNSPIASSVSEPKGTLLTMLMLAVVVCLLRRYRTGANVAPV